MKQLRIYIDTSVLGGYFDSDLNQILEEDDEQEDKEI